MKRYRPTHPLSLSGFAAAALALTGACSQGLDRPSEIRGLRVLAIQANPPEVLLDAPGSFDVRFTALVVDPRGGSVDFAWQFCPVESSKACADYDAKRSAAPETYRTALDDMRAFASSGTAEPVPSATGLDESERATRDLWPHALPDFDISAPAELFAYHLETSFFGAGAGAWPSTLLRVSTSDGRDPVLAAKRFVLGILDLRAAAEPIAAELGYEVCPPGVTPAERPGCLDIAPRVPNSNPIFERLQIARGELAGTAFEDVTGIVDLAAGESLRVRPVFTADSYEPYQRLETDVDTRRITLVDTVEALSVSWFVSAGEVQDDLTWPKFTKELDTVFTAPKRVPDNGTGLATIYLVARDQRGGVAWQHLEVRITP